jgi:hypothetical protein
VRTQGDVDDEAERVGLLFAIALSERLNRYAPADANELRICRDP